MYHSANGWRQLASSICKSFLPTSVHLFAKSWRQLPSSICRRFLSTSMHPSANGWRQLARHSCRRHLPTSVHPSANGWRQLVQLAPNTCRQLLPISLHISANGWKQLAKTVHELRYSLACSNVVVGQAARRTCAGASFQTKLRLTFILNMRCCRHCSPYSPRRIAGEFGIANWSGPNTPTAVGEYVLNMCVWVVNLTTLHLPWAGYDKFQGRCN